jgi:hypothetical protein
MFIFSCQKAGGTEKQHEVEPVRVADTALGFYKTRDLCFLLYNFK